MFGFLDQQNNPKLLRESFEIDVLCPASHMGRFFVFAVVLKVQFARKSISGSHPNTDKYWVGNETQNVTF